MRPFQIARGLSLISRSSSVRQPARSCWYRCQSQSQSQSQTHPIESRRYRSGGSKIKQDQKDDNRGRRGGGSGGLGGRGRGGHFSKSGQNASEKVPLLSNPTVTDLCHKALTEYKRLDWAASKSPPSVTVDHLFQSLSKTIKNSLPAIEKLLKSMGDDSRVIRSNPIMNAFAEYRRDLDKTPSKFDEFDQDVTQFKDYAKHPPLVPMLSRIYAILSVDTTDTYIEDLIIRLLVGSFLRFYQAKIRISYNFDGENTPSVVLRNPGEWFPEARSINRKVILHVGPTNSGKTYNALKRLESAESGYYAGPLRLLAREVYNRMKSAGKLCNLITGEEVIEDIQENGKPCGMSSGTIEMIELHSPMEVAVIDEIQMIEDPYRGFAWTNALLGVQAKEIHLCGDPSSEKIITKLCERLGDKLEIRRYERLGALTVAKDPIKHDLSGLKEGDCVIAFSRNSLLDWKAEIENATGDQCAIIYGALPPESRTRQADAFNDPDSDHKYLVASDAIGMGLNLGVKRIIFLSTQKYNGHRLRKISVSQVKQIAGRAGRFRTSHDSQSSKTGSISKTPPSGVVTAMNRVDLAYLKECLAQDTPEIKSAGLYPPDSMLKHYALRFPPSRLFYKILETLELTAEIGGGFFLCGIENMIEVAKIFSRIDGLLIDEQIALSKSPVKTNLESCVKAFHYMCTVIAESQTVTVLDIPGIDIAALRTSSAFYSDKDIFKLEEVHANIILFMWLSYRFPVNFIDRTGATQLKNLCEEKIDEALNKTRSFRLAKWRESLDYDSLVTDAGPKVAIPISR